MCALQSRRIDRIFKNQLSAIAITALVATLASGCQTPVETNPVPSTLVLSVRTPVIAAGGASITVEARLLSDSGQGVAGVSIVFVTEHGNFVPGSVIFTDAGGLAAVTLEVTETTTIRALALDGLIVSNEVVLPLEIVEGSPITLSIEFEFGRPTAQKQTTVTFRAIRDEGKPKVQGKLSVTFGDGTKTRNFSDFARVHEVRHTYEKPGRFEVEAVLVLSTFQIVTKRRMITVLEEPAPAPAPKAPPNAPPNADDALDLSTVRFLHANVTGWKVTSTITGTRIETQEICVFHTAASRWPAPSGTYGNPWVIAKIGGTWYAGTFEWMRPGQVCKALDPGAGGATIADRIGPHVKVEPLTSWKPRKGDIVGLMYSGWARDSRRSVEERSNVVLVTWPY